MGHTAEEIEKLRAGGVYDPMELYKADLELRRVLDAIRDNQFVPTQPDLFKDITNALTTNGDYYFHLADYRAYINAQAEVDALYRRQKDWIRKAILNVARAGKFSSDRTILEYASEIWHVVPCEVGDLA